MLTKTICSECLVEMTLLTSDYKYMQDNQCSRKCKQIAARKQGYKEQRKKRDAYTQMQEKKLKLWGANS